MWLLVAFDLPTDTKKARADYRVFREHLLENGFLMIQYSIYAKYCSSGERADKFRRRIKNSLPPDGEVRIFRLTDKQYEKTDIFHGVVRATPEEAPRQLEIF